MEDFKKNVVLLSAVAKEKKYAQEYLGLLARRGDIGSIRIGKRWYTKMEWFSEFLADAEARKAEAKPLVFSAMPVKEKIGLEKEIIAKETAPLEKIVEHSIKITKSLETSEEKIAKADSRINFRIVRPVTKDPAQEENKIISSKSEEVKIIAPRIINPKPVLKKSFVAGKKLETINLKTKRNIKPVFQRAAPNVLEAKKFFPEKKNQPMPTAHSPVIDNWLKRSEYSSPNFVSTGSRTGFFPKFAFSMSAVLLLVLLIQFGWVYRNELKGMIGVRSGTVAGAENSKVSLSVFKNSSVGYLGDQEDKIKENVSLSRVLIRAAMEKNTAEVK
ncbi:MAG: hypothetical protein PHP25_00540 [Candidatus Moranbacteria bacterium]|nr:hypothetical protein [Candidatus Moranbacteria bacterium]